jgi:hypothetical protein
MSDDAKQMTGFVKLHHSSGALVTLPVPDHTDFDYVTAFRNVTAAIAAGFTVSASGLEAGEHVEQIGYVVRRSKDSREGGTTPVVDLYPANDAAKFAVLSVYLNTDDDVKAFEKAAGMTLDKIPLYIGDNKIERGKKKDTDKLVAKAPHPFGVVLMANPKYDEAEATATKAKGDVYPVAKRKFVRWATAPTAAPQTKPADAEPEAELVTRDVPLVAPEVSPPTDEFRYLMAGVRNAGSQPSLAAAWGEVNDAVQGRRLSVEQVRELTAAKNARKEELARPKAKA